MVGNRTGLRWSPISQSAVLEHDSVVVSVATTATPVIGGDPYRVALLLQNIGANQINVDISDGVTTTSGIVLSSGSEPLFINDDRMPGLAARGFHGIASTGATGLLVMSVRIIE